ncbi:MAG: SPOR domain-containing protein [Methylococcaceae bacterium]|nr:SPOR domain-containing protein [Methylococcaceae bacterium]MCI0666776.1 SPOR domain-containing protein [Methylococcaceae bacterium]MCI0733363.1 SPOR domain-containing protein [Methylococcaceae bacterium]
MTKDYKHRTSRKGNRQNNGVSIGRWLLAVVLLGLFISFLAFLRNPEPPVQPSPVMLKKPVPKKEPEPKAVKKTSEAPAEKPRFEFYTILPEQEVEIPETEIKIRKSEEKQGKAKPGRYVLQVGSFRKFKDADRRKAELAMLGIHSKIEAAKLDDSTWNRVKIGPYTSMTAVDVVRKRLRLQNIDAIVISAK